MVRDERIEFTHVYDMYLSIMEAEPQLDEDVVFEIADRNHCGRGYFSYDGILDALAEIVGSERASEIVGSCP